MPKFTERKEKMYVHDVEISLLGCMPMKYVRATNY